MNSFTAQEETSKFLFDCIQSGLSASFAILSDSPDDTYYCQFSVWGFIEKGLPCGLEFEVAGPKNTGTEKASDHARFAQLLKLGWCERSGNAYQRTDTIKTFGEVADVVKRTITTLTALYQLPEDIEWSIDTYVEPLDSFTQAWKSPAAPD